MRAINVLRGRGFPQLSSTFALIVATRPEIMVNPGSSDVSTTARLDGTQDAPGAPIVNEAVLPTLITVDTFNVLTTPSLNRKRTMSEWIPSETFVELATTSKATVWNGESIDPEGGTLSQSMLGTEEKVTGFAVGFDNSIFAVPLAPALTGIMTPAGVNLPPNRAELSWTFSITGTVCTVSPHDPVLIRISPKYRSGESPCGFT